MAANIIAIIASLLAVIASVVVGKFMLKYIQAYRVIQQKKELERLRVEAQFQNQKANLESDKLKAIDGR